MQDKLSRNVSCLLACSSSGGQVTVRSAPLPDWPVPMGACRYQLICLVEVTTVCSSFRPHKP